MQDASNSQGRANMVSQASLTTQLSMFLPPPDTTNELTLEEEDELAWQVAEQKDMNATIRLYKCHLAGVFYFFYRRTGNVHETEDLTEETFCRAIEGLLDGSWLGQPFRAWLFVIAKYVFFEWLRAKKKRSALAYRNGSYQTAEEEQIEEAGLLDEMFMREQGAMLWGLVKHLLASYQQVLFLRHVLDLSYAEIAARMDRTENACKALHWRALQKLREKVLQAGLGEEFGVGKGK